MKQVETKPRKTMYMHFRLDRELYEAVKSKNVNVSELIRDALEKFVKSDKKRAQ